MKRKYKAKMGARFSHDEAKIFGAFLDRAFHGRGITAEMVVKKASNKDCPVHSFFEWDDKKAAHGYRLEQARNYIAHIVIWNGEKDGVRAFHNVVVGDRQEYVSFDTAINTPDLWTQVVDKALEEARLWAERYKQYSELSPIRTAIMDTYKIVKGQNEKEERRAV